MLISLQLPGLRPFDSLDLRRSELDLQHTHQAGHDLILEREKFVHCAVDLRHAHDLVRVSVDEPGRDSDRATERLEPA